MHDILVTGSFTLNIPPLGQNNGSHVRSPAQHVKQYPFFCQWRISCIGIYRNSNKRLGTAHSAACIQTVWEVSISPHDGLIRGLWCQEPKSQAGISNWIPQNNVERNYFSLHEIPAPGTNVLISRNEIYAIKLYSHSNHVLVYYQTLTISCLARNHIIQGCFEVGSRDISLY